jgi:hypothetical protein
VLGVLAAGQGAGPQAVAVAGDGDRGHPEVAGSQPGADLLHNRRP